MATTTNGPRERQRHFNDGQCKTIAERIKIEMDLYPAALENYRQTSIQKSGDYRFAFVPVWGPDLEAVKEKVTVLYQADEAAVINGVLG